MMEETAELEGEIKSRNQVELARPATGSS
ncbi:unnamed protein product [Victoria cruziana]